MDFEHDEISGDHYHDLGNKPCTLLELIRQEPEWAATRIKQGEFAEKKLAALSQPVAGVDGKLTAAIAEMEKCVRCLALELHEAVHGDVVETWDALKTALSAPAPAPVAGVVVKGAGK